jgi:arylsulfatase A-like enzyme
MSLTTRREFLKRTGAAAGAALLAGQTLPTWAADAEQTRKNVLFLAVDDLRPQLGCYGHGQMISPNIDALATQGMRFRRAYCQVPVCGASRASLLTGLRPTPKRFLSYKAKKDRDAPDAVSLPKHFKDNGYVTLSRNKVYHSRGDDLEAWSQEPWRIRDWRVYLTPEGKRISQRRRRRAGPAWEGADVDDNAYPDGKCADRLIEDLRSLAKGDKPFFLAGGFVKPHLPFNCPKKYWDMYKRDEIDLADNPFRPKGAPDVALHNWGELRAYAGIPGRGRLDDETARALIHGYYACVSYVDAQVGRVLDELDRQGLAENTVVVLWGDHGWQLGEHGMWCKHCNFETSLHSPLIVRAPGYRAGLQSNALVEFVDIYPSLCELAGLETPDSLEGQSFEPLLRDPRRKWKPAAFSRYKGGDSVKTDRFRYTEWRNQRGDLYARMMYDHEKDPNENVNIVDAPEYADEVKRMVGWVESGWKAARVRV